MSRTSTGPDIGATTPNAFERLVVLANPVSTQVDQAHGMLNELDDSEYVGDRRVYVPTERDPYLTKEKLAEAVHEGDAVIVAGGDKTVGDAADVLLGTKIPLVPIWAGNANDIAHMLNGKPGRHSLLDILAGSNVVRLYPISRQTSWPDGTRRTQTAANYTGFGLSGLISHRVNEPGYRGHPSYHHAGFRNRHENLIGVSAALDRPRFSLAWNSETPSRFSAADRRVTEVLDLTVANGDRMGKRSRVLPVGLAEQRLFVGRIEAPWGKAVAGIARMALHHTAGDYLEPGEVLAFQLLTEAWSHTDGDASQLPAAASERIWQSDVPYLALSMNIAPDGVPA